MVNKLSLLEGFPKERLSEGDIAEFGEAARLARQWVLTMTTVANSGHPAGSLSGMEIYLVTYAVSSLRPHNADSLDRDFVVISHGHTSPGRMRRWHITAFSPRSCWETSGAPAVLLRGMWRGGALA